MDECARRSPRRPWAADIEISRRGRLAPALGLVLSLAAFAGLPGPARAEPPAFGGPKILIHGNYCGPGNNAPLPPIDALDAACARHDACTPDHGLPSRACNLRLEQDADRISRDPRQPPDVRAAASFVAAGAAMMQAAGGLAVAPIAPPTGVRR